MAKLSFLDVVWQSRLPPPLAVDMTGKTVIVVGANIGLGLEVAKHYARMAQPPARLILACRSKAKAEAAAEEIKRETGYAGAEVRLIDLKSFASIDAFAKDFDDGTARLDTLICNAAMAGSIYEPTADGWDAAIQVNCLSEILLGILLAPCMLRTAREHGSYARLHNVSSGIHLGGSIPKAAIDSPKILAALNKEEALSAPMALRYTVTKVINVFHTRAFNARLAPSAPLVVTSCDPGFCLSALRRDVPWWLKLPMDMFEWLCARTGEEGARVLLYAAEGPGDGGSVDGMKGRYVANCAVAEESDFVLSPTGAECERRIWEETVDILEKAVPRVRRIVDEHLSGH